MGEKEGGSDPEMGQKEGDEKREEQPMLCMYSCIYQ